MKISFVPGTTGIFCLFLIPYMFSIIFNGVDSTLINKKFDTEMILPIVVASQIEENYELETIKAQSIIARSNLYIKMKEQKNLADTLSQIWKDIKSRSFYLAVIQPQYEKAVEETEGKVLTWNGELKAVPYHQISAGQTRSGEEVFHSEDEAYLKSVQSNVDKKSKDFLNSVYINKNVLPERIEIKSRDSAGYVTEILADGKVLEGEAFRKGMGLTSSNFTIQKSGKEIRFLCRGKGHGLGFSQYGGNEMAKESANAEEILQYYFPEMDVLNIKSVNC